MCDDFDNNFWVMKIKGSRYPLVIRGAVRENISNNTIHINYGGSVTASVPNDCIIDTFFSISPSVYPEKTAHDKNYLSYREVSIINALLHNKVKNYQRVSCELFFLSVLTEEFILKCASLKGKTYYFDLNKTSLKRKTLKELCKAIDDHDCCNDDISYELKSIKKKVKNAKKKV